MAYEIMEVNLVYVMREKGKGKSKIRSVHRIAKSKDLPTMFIIVIL